jgi:DNA polymerase-1
VNRLLLLDGDILAYRHASAAEKATDWGDGMWTLHADEGVAIDNLGLEVDRIASNLSADKMVMCLSDDIRRFRDQFTSVYKEHRKDIRKPMILGKLRQHIRETWETKDKPGLEADDVMGILSTNPKLYPGYEKVIVSIDKDMRTIPGLLSTGAGREVMLITRDQADSWHLQQTLMGDKADGYPGCPGVGPVKAERIVKGGWPAVLEAFVNAGKDEEYALTMARLARILRHEDWDYKKQEPILWTPE